jgi:hypothetical protein
MFDEEIKDGKWVVTYRTPDGELSRTIPMQKKPAFDRYEMHEDAVAIEKVDGANQRRIVKPDFAQWLKSQQPEKVEMASDYDILPEHNEEMNVAGSHNFLTGLAVAGLLTGIISFFCALFPDSVKFILIVSTVVVVIITVVWFIYIFTHHKSN